MPFVRRVDPWSAATVTVLLLTYLGAHLLLRLGMNGALGYDDAEQALFAQHFAWGYRTVQPPLYTWLLVPAIELFGPNLFAVILPRYLLLGLTFVLMHRVALRWTGDPRAAALAVFSFALIYVFAYYAHHDLTHTTALGAAIAATFYGFALLVERPSSVWRYALLGLAMGLGLLTKWNFVMLAAGLPLACLLYRPFRPLVLDWKVIVALAIVAVIVAPTGLWLLEQGATPATVSSAALPEAAAGGPMASLVRGTLALLGAALLFPMPFLLIFAVLFGSASWRGWRAARTGWPTPVGPRFLALLVGVTLGLHWLLVPILGTDAFTARWMHPALMVLPVLAFQLAAAGGMDDGPVRLYLVVVLLFVAVALGARVVRHAQGADACGRCREMAPFAELAEQLRAAGFRRGTIVADGMHAAGNLRLRFPDSRVLDPAFAPEAFPPPDGQGQCLAVWPAGDTGAPIRRQRVLSYLWHELDLPAAAVLERGEVSAPMAGSSTRVYTLGYAFEADGAGDCR